MTHRTRDFSRVPLPASPDLAFLPAKPVWSETARSFTTAPSFATVLPFTTALPSRDREGAVPRVSVMSIETPSFNGAHQ